ncbi:MAG TPA: aldo/keto reductase [Patescibacteria group bacterium]|jgi:aryl-alcohol dehydrogenase-like predicted oxidoreductase|nr:aldo/keto reductase [Patescibacteria group bacterium]
MKYRTLGRTGLKVSLICLGTMTWGRQNTEAEGHEQMDYALAQGVNFFDTAEMYAVPPTPDTYGRTEEIIGTWFASRKNRDKVILASKVAGPGLPWVRGGKARVDRENIIAAVDGSLRRLRTDYIDLYQLHWTNRDDYHWGAYWEFMPDPADTQEHRENFLEVLRTLDSLIKVGKIRHAGLSNDTAWGAMEYLRLARENNLPVMASIQNEYNLLCRLFEPDLAEIALRESIGLLAWSPLAGGMISGKYLNGARPQGSRWSLDERPLHRDTKEANEAVHAYIDVAKKHGLDVCQMALAFVNRQPFVTANIIGATSMEQLKSNIASIDLTLSDAVLADIDAVRRRYPIPF